MNEVAVDTTLLIDLQRSVRNDLRKRAEDWLENHPNTVLKIPSIVLGEFSAGFEDPDDPELVALRQRHEVLHIGVEVARCYARHYRRMKLAGTLIGGNDLWIAATVEIAELPILTRNAEHFERIEGLQVETY